MPSFDVVSKINLQEIDNAVNSVLRELTNRYDFKGANFSIELNSKENTILIIAPDEYKLNAISDSLKVYCTKRSIDPKALDFQKEEKASQNCLRQLVKLKTGIDQETAKKIVKEIKSTKIKVQSSIKADELRIDGKKRDDLQEIMDFIKKNDYNLPLQFINFRD